MRAGRPQELPSASNTAEGVGLGNRRSLVRIQSGAFLRVPLRAALPVQSRTVGLASDQRSEGASRFRGVPERLCQRHEIMHPSIGSVVGSCANEPC
jgi:hypothetical protein